MADNVKFREELAEESDFPLSDAIYNLIVDNSEEVSYRKGDLIVDIGSTDSNAYFVREGVVRGSVLIDGDDRTVCFGLLTLTMRHPKLQEPQKYPQPASVQV